VAEWLGKGLQNLVQRFESARDLREEAVRKNGLFFFYTYSVADEFVLLPQKLPPVAIKNQPYTLFRIQSLGISSLHPNITQYLSQQNGYPARLCVFTSS
jgi:hypothetical protein